LTATPTSAGAGASVTLKATVAGNGIIAPTGSVSFLEGANTLGTATLNASGVASVSVSALSVGQHAIVAVYAGDSNYNASTSAAASVTIGAADFAFTAASSAMTVTHGGSATMGLTVTPQGVFAQPITFSCSNLPAGVSCSFAPYSVTPQGSPASITMTVTALSSVARIMNRSMPWGGGPLLAASVLGIALGRRRRHAALLALWLVVLNVALLAGGCGGSNSHKPVTSTIQVTAAAGAIQHSVSISVTVN